jgi:CheY-like chemotaxis protein
MNPTPSGSMRVLVVDDNKNARQALCATLKLLGYATREVGSGRDALEAATRSLPDVVLFALNSPGANGYEVVRWLRELPGGGRVLLAAVTGEFDHDTLDRGREVGFDAFLPEPVELPFLEELLRNHELTRGGD